MNVIGLKQMMQKFETTGSFDVQPDRGRKQVHSTVVEEVASALQEGLAGGVIPCSARGIPRSSDRPTRTVLKIVRNILRCYPCKIANVQVLLPSDLAASETFALEFLVRIEVDNDWLWKIVWTDEAHFHLTGDVNTQNCRIWTTENSLATHPVPLHPEKVSVRCCFMA